MRALAVSVVLAALAVAPGARADVFSDYTTTGSLDPCAYSAGELRAALRAVTPNVRQYASDYPGEVRRAIRARRSGSCDAAAATPAPTAAQSTPPAPAATPAAPAPTAAPAPAGQGGSPALLLAAAALLGVLALALAVAFAVRRDAARHALREARWRGGGLWAELRDWLSLGR